MRRLTELSGATPQSNNLWRKKEEVERMEISIKGNPKEIAALVLELQERQGDDRTECDMDAKTSAEPAFVPHDSNGINNDGVSQEFRT